MKAGPMEILLLALIFLILFGPFVLEKLEKLLRYITRNKRRWSIRLERGFMAFARGCQILAVLTLVILLAAELILFFIARR